MSGTQAVLFSIISAIQSEIKQFSPRVNLYNKHVELDYNGLRFRLGFLRRNDVINNTYDKLHYYVIKSGSDSVLDKGSISFKKLDGKLLHDYEWIIADSPNLKVFDASPRHIIPNTLKEIAAIIKFNFINE